MTRLDTHPPFTRRDASSQFLLSWAAAPAIILGVWLMGLSGAPRSAQILQVAVAGVAAALAVVSARRYRVKPAGDAHWLVLAMTVSLFLPLLDGAQDGPARWLVLGNNRVYIAPVVLPLIVFLMGAPWRIPPIYAASIAVAASALALQPDASQLTAFALAMLVHLVSSRSSRPLRVALSVTLLCCAVIAWRAPDPLAPVRYVEGIFSIAAEASPFALMAALIAAALPVVAFARVARIERSSGAFAVVVYFATLFGLAPLQITPVPLLGFGAGPIVGYFLVAGAASRLRVSHVGATVATKAVFALAAAIIASSCTSLGLPRTPVTAESPDRRFVAFVRNHPSIDPPDQSVWLTDRSGATTMLRKLGGDSEWCNRIVWSGDNTIVGFVIMDAKLETYDVATRRLQSSIWLNGFAGEYPPAGVVTDVALSADGRIASFKACSGTAAARTCSQTKQVALSADVSLPVSTVQRAAPPQEFPVTIAVTRDVILERYSVARERQRPRELLQFFIASKEEKSVVIRRGETFQMVSKKSQTEGGCRIRFQDREYEIASCWWLDGFSDQRSDIFVIK